MAESQYSFQNLFDLNELKQLFENFSAATGFTTGLVEHSTGKVLIGTGWRDICTEFHRATPESSRHCEASNRELTTGLTVPGKIKINQCQNGLVDGATPIIINNTHYANLFSGQIFFEPPDIKRFKKQAAEFGYDEEAYLNALARVPIVNEAEFKNALEFLARLATFITAQGISQLEFLNQKKQLKKEITERKHTEEILKKSSEYLDLILNGMSDALMVINRDYTITDVNSRFIERYKGRREDIIGRHCYEISHRESRPCAKNHPCPLKQVIKNKSPVVVEHSHLDREGNEQIVELYSFPLFDDQAEVIQVVEVIHDITEQKKAEKEHKKLHAQLRHAQKMEAIGNLAGGIAHDFNNILVPIFGNTELAKSYIPADNPAQNRLDEIIKSSNRAKELVKQILSFARKSEQKFGPVQIHLIVEEVLELIRASIPATIDIQRSIDRQCGFVLADPTQLHQVVMNLCTNAFQAIEDEKGTLEIILKTEEITPDSETGGQIIEPGTYVMLSVRDSGDGIDPTITELIFDPYFSTKKPDKGSGLGLAVVQGIVKNHKGFIKLESALGKGSTFKVFFPQVDTEAALEDTAPEILPGGDESILFVDDEKPVVDVWKLILRSLGYKVTARTSSVEALEIFRAQPEKFDLVITDHAMPKMPGSEFAKELLKLRPDIPIILCTGYSSIMSDEKAKSIGIKEFLMKPIETHVLAGIIRNILEEQ